MGPRLLDFRIGTPARSLDPSGVLRAFFARLHIRYCIASVRQPQLNALGAARLITKHIRLRQRKTGARVVIPVGAPLKAALDATPKRSTIILTNSDGKPWTSDGFRASWGKALQGRRRNRRDVQRPARHGSDTACDRRMHRGRNCHRHRSLAARRARGPRLPLLESRSGAWRKCDPKARKGAAVGPHHAHNSRLCAVSTSHRTPYFGNTRT
jgi:hypothetical protein